MPQPHATESIAVFLGPSLPLHEARSILDAHYYPPAKQGDVYRVMTSGVRLIVLIDGVFHGSPSVWQRELLAALDEGIQVVGASSMGALRAVELFPYGMVGYGTVFDWYQTGVIEADDEVALTHGTHEHDYRPLSEPLVNLRASLASAEREGIIDSPQAETLLREALRTHFAQRSYASLVAGTAFSELDDGTQLRLREFLEEEPVNIKAEDARVALREAKTLSAEPSPLAHRRDVSIWDVERVLGAGVHLGGKTFTVREVLTRAKSDPSLWASALVGDTEEPWGVLSRRLAQHFFVLTHGRENMIFPSETELKSRVDALRSSFPLRELWKHGLTERRVNEELERRAVYRWLVEEVGGGDPGKVIEEWAKGAGVSLLHGPSTRLSDAITRLGATYFGYEWNSDVAFARELQFSGVVPKIAEGISG